MSGYVVQITLIFILTLINAHAKKPHGYVAPPKEYDPNPPKYEYGYRIQDEKATQGKDEQRDGIYAQGRYYVENGTESTQKVKYFADEWGYHPVVEYSNIGPHSKSSTNFVLGEEAIKLKNNQKSIPQDPSDPGKADNLSKLNPSDNQHDHQLQGPADAPNFPLTTQPQPDQIDLSSTSRPLQSYVQENPTQIISHKGQEHDVLTLTTPDSIPQSIESSTLNSINPISQSLHNHPELIVQNDPHLQVFTNQPNQQLENRQILVEFNSPQPQVVTRDPNSSHEQPIFYYVQPQNSYQSTDGLPESFSQLFIQRPKDTTNGHIYQQHQANPIQQSGSSLQQLEDQNLQQLEALPQSQALVVGNNNYYTDHSFIDSSPKGDVEKVLETAALIKAPNKIVKLQNSSPGFSYKEFGTKLVPEQKNKLIESTKSLVSGDDVLDINAALSQKHDTNDDIETSTLQNLLHKYITPTLVSNRYKVGTDNKGVSSSTTFTPPVTTTELSLLEEPIIVAESESESGKTDEYLSSTAGTTIAAITLSSNKENIETSSDQILVTPRPVSSKFLAAITAGIQLQHIDEQIFEDSKRVETHEEKKNKVAVQIQRTIPYYLGMYEYPLGYDVQSNNRNISAEQDAVQNIELGKTLLYFPEGEAPKAEQLIQESPNKENIQISYLESNQLNGPQPTPENSNEKFVGDQLQSQVFVHENAHQYEYIQERPHSNLPLGQYSYPTLLSAAHEKHAYPVETVPIEVTKYVKRPYPVEVPVPYPQTYPVEKVVETVVKESYPVEVNVPVRVEVPYYVEKPVENFAEKSVPNYINRPYSVREPTSEAYLLQIPGLFSQQKYSSLVHNTYQPQSAQLLYSYLNEHQSNKESGRQLQTQRYSVGYAPQNNHYLPPQQHISISKGRIPQKLRKLNLLVFPRQNIANFPPITKNSHDSYRGATSHQSYRQSNAQLNNGYLPPAPQNSNADHNHQLETSPSNKNTYSIEKATEHIGLMPPTRPLFDDSGNHRNARAHFDDKSIRLEYGFMPPLIPSLEIDEHGQPIEKDDNKN